MRPTIARLVALGLILSACTSGAAETPETSTTTEPTTTTSTTTTTTTSTTTIPPTTTTIDDRGTSRINGRPVDDPELLNRRLLAVKIDNHPRANPQSGIDLADMIIELRVEGITRYISIWHESDADYLGPMRSGRPTDPTLLSAFNEPTFAISGAQAWVRSLIVSKDVNLVGETGPPSTFRISSRSAPHNLYVNTELLREVSTGRGYPDEPPTGPIWEFGLMSDNSDPVTSVDIDFSGTSVIWKWDEVSELWLRTVNGQEGTFIDEDGTESPMGVPVMVALYVEQYTAFPPAGVSGKPLPSSRTTGTGKAFVFADGRVTEGTWERDSEQDWFILKDANGEIIPVPVGKPLVSLVPSHRGLTYES